MTDEFMIQVIAKRMDEECGFDKVAQVLNHQSWVDVVSHLLTEKGLRAALVQAYQPELDQAMEEQEERRSRESSYAEWRADSSLRRSESDGMPL